jgi:ABC-type transporter Mla maintaining outer membrane lipid asymmetry ATPase subunit MlaF
MSGEHDPSSMTVADQDTGDDDEIVAIAGTVVPQIRGRLRTRLPSRVRTARSQLLVMVAYLLVTPLFLGFEAIIGGLAKLNLATTDLLAATVGNIVAAAACYLAARLIYARSRVGYYLGVGVAAFIGGASIFAISRVISGSAGLTGNPAFFYTVYQAFYLLFAAAIFINLLRELAWSRTLVREARKSTGQGLQVPLRDIRIHAGKSRTEVVLPGSAEEAAAQAERRSQEPLLAVRGLKKHFPIHGGMLRRQIGTVYAVDGVDFDVYPGEIFSLVGESGCGKTTLGRTVLQLTPPTAGRVVFDGYELADVDPDDMRPLRRRMQIIFQDPFGSLNPRMPISDIIGEGLLAQGVSDRKTRDKRVEDSLEIVGLRRDYTRRYPHEFSGGQRQRVGIAELLAQPAAGVESASRRWRGRRRHIALQDEPLLAPPWVGVRDRRQERDRIRVARVLVELLDRAELGDLAQVHDADPVAEVLDDRKDARAAPTAAHGNAGHTGSATAVSTTDWVATTCETAWSLTSSAK